MLDSQGIASGLSSSYGRLRRGPMWAVCGMRIWCIGCALWGTAWCWEGLQRVGFRQRAARPGQTALCGHLPPEVLSTVFVLEPQH